ncbi:hypothetical protein [Labrenzia sp. DG1229]|uniref:hypothetical protein n=1 Tax=Labrenzia sp. DG1229 TaxID=681847 RepID=UPI0012EC03A6|nr:hypothetical protein [Labrenzia sp. DG1229]
MSGATTRVGMLMVRVLSAVASELPLISSDVMRSPLPTANEPWMTQPLRSSGTGNSRGLTAARLRLR